MLRDRLAVDIVGSILVSTAKKVYLRVQLEWILRELLQMDVSDIVPLQELNEIAL